MGEACELLKIKAEKKLWSTYELAVQIQYSSTTGCNVCIAKEAYVESPSELISG